MFAACRAWGAVLLAGLCVFMMGGIVFGVASLYPVLFDQRALRRCDTCNPRLPYTGSYARGVARVPRP